MALHPTFEKFLEPLRDKSTPIGARLQYAFREITLTQQANEALRDRGDVQGVKAGEEYLKAIKDLFSAEGINLDTLKSTATRDR